MKVLIINYEFPPLGGGGGVATYDLALEWARTAQVDVLTSSFRDLKSYEVVEGINVHRVRIFFRTSRDSANFLSMLSYLPGAFVKGIILILKNRYDVINTHFAVPSGPVGLVLGKLFRIPNVLSLHGGDIYDPSKKTSPHNSIFWKFVVRFILNRADRIVAQSSNTRNNAIQYYNPKKEIGIIPLPFHPPAKTKATRKGLGIDKDDFIVVTIGRIVKRKAFDVLIKAVGGIADDRIRLIIIGEGPERENLTHLVKDLGIERVIFLGFIGEREKFEYISTANLFALTSLHEGFGIVFMESMHFGLPIVCTNNGGQVDFLINEENAIYINVGDVEACSNAILRFKKDRKLYAKCAKNNEKKVKDFYAGPVADRYLEIFRNLCHSDK